MAETQVTAITTDELSSILSGNVDSILTPEEKKPEEKVETKEVKETKSEQKTDDKFKTPINTDFETWESLKKLTEDEGEENTKNVETKEEIKPEEKVEKKEQKPGRKPAEFVSLINELVEGGELVGFDDGPVNSIEEAKELIKLNLSEREKSSIEKVWEEKVKSYSPQIQAILHYAEQGGQDVSTLMGAISEIEKTSDFEVESEKGQESVIREYLKLQDWSDEEINEEIETAKDVDKLKSKAEKFLPKLQQMNQERIEAIMAEQEQRNRDAEEARRNYISTIKTHLDKDVLGDVKLTKKEKSLIWNGLTDVSYTSWTGQPTNAFFKKLEEIQAGKTADYDHFLQVVHLALDPKGYKDIIKAEIKAEQTAETVRKLKIQESKKSSTSDDDFEESKKPVIRRQGFKNPWS